MIAAAVIAILVFIVTGQALRISRFRRAFDELQEFFADWQDVAAANRASATNLRRQLTQAQLHRDARQPTHEIIEYLVVHGPADIAELIEEFGPYVGRQLGDLTTESEILRTDENHRTWWVEIDDRIALGAPGALESDGGRKGAMMAHPSYPKALSEPPAGSRGVLGLTEWMGR